MALGSIPKRSVHELAPSVHGLSPTALGRHKQRRLAEVPESQIVRVRGAPDGLGGGGGARVGDGYTRAVTDGPDGACSHRNATLQPSLSDPHRHSWASL